MLNPRRQVLVSLQTPGVSGSAGLWKHQGSAPAVPGNAEGCVGSCGILAAHHLLAGLPGHTCSLLLEFRCGWDSFNSWIAPGLCVHSSVPDLRFVLSDLISSLFLLISY